MSGGHSNFHMHSLYFSQNLVVQVAPVEVAAAAAGTNSQHMDRRLRRMVVTSSRSKLLLTARSTANGIRRKLMGCNRWEDTKHLKQPPMPSRQIICPTNNLSTPMDSHQQLQQQRR
jgi:hypothetical protein